MAFPRVGVFPCDEVPYGKDSAQEYYDLQLQFKNYSSYYEHKEAAHLELQREHGLGYLSFGTLGQLSAKYGKLQPSKIAVLVKKKAGNIEVRLIHDLRTSNINRRVKVPERVTLPRPSDMIHFLCQALSAKVVVQGWICWC